MNNNTITPEQVGNALKALKEKDPIKYMALLSLQKEAVEKVTQNFSVEKEELQKIINELESN